MPENSRNELPDDIASLHGLERQSRRQFVEGWRNRLSFLLGYPEGIPNIKNSMLARILKIPGMDEYTRIDIWKPDNQIHLHYLKVDYGLDEISRSDIHLRVPAYQGFTYALNKEMRHADLNGAFSRSNEAHNLVGLSDPVGVEFTAPPSTPYYSRGRFSQYAIDTAKPFTFDLGLDMDSRMQVARTLGPIIDTLTPEQLESHRRRQQT